MKSTLQAAPSMTNGADDGGSPAGGDYRLQKRLANSKGEESAATTESPNTDKPEVTGECADAQDCLSDAALLRRFLKEGDDAAFVALVNRYERLVMGVALRQVGDRHRAEDVFQATFLVLAERGARIRRPDALASWLHGTARRIGLRALGQQKRERSMDQTTSELAIDDAPLQVLQQAFEQQVLDDELAKLPDRLRLPLILHYLEGLTAQEVADRLGVPVTTIEGRLKKGRLELRERLVRHGVGFSVLLAAFALSQKLAIAATGANSGAAASTLAGVAARSALHWFHQQQLAGGSANAVRLASQEIAMINSAKITTTLLTCAALCLAMGVGGTLAWGQFGGGGLGGQFGGRLPKSSQWVQHEIDAEAADNAVRVVPSEDGPAQADPATGTIGFMDPATGQATMLNVAGPATLDPRQVLDGAQDYRTLSPSHATIEKALEEGTFDFPDAGRSLADLVEILGGQLEIPVYLDMGTIVDELGFDDPQQALDALTLGRRLPGLTAGEALSFLLKSLPAAPGELDYIIRDGVLTITTAEAAREFQDVAIYEVRHLGSNYPPHDVAMLIESMAPEASWEAIDGEGGTIKIIPGGVVVRQTQRVHREIRDLLRQLEQFAARTDLPQATRDPNTMRLNDDNWSPPDDEATGGGQGFF